jgi:hypothetical protein
VQGHRLGRGIAGCVGEGRGPIISVDCGQILFGALERLALRPESEDFLARMIDDVKQRSGSAEDLGGWYRLTGIQQRLTQPARGKSGSPGVMCRLRSA